MCVMSTAGAGVMSGEDAPGGTGMVQPVELCGAQLYMPIFPSAAYRQAISFLLARGADLFRDSCGPTSHASTCRSALARHSITRGLLRPAVRPLLRCCGRRDFPRHQLRQNGHYFPRSCLSRPCAFNHASHPHVCPICALLYLVRIPFFSSAFATSLSRATPLFSTWLGRTNG